MPPKRLADIAAPAAPQVAVEPVVQPKENKAQRAKVERGLAQVPIEKIRVDGLVRFAAAEFL